MDEEEEEMEDKPNQQQTYVSGYIMFIVFSFMFFIVFRGGNSFQDLMYFPKGFFPRGNFPGVFS